MTDRVHSTRFESSWINLSSTICPPRGIVQVSGYREVNGHATIEGIQCDDADAPFFVNGSFSVPPDGYGAAAFREPFIVRCSDTVAVGDAIGLKVGTWDASSDGSGIEVLGPAINSEVLAVRAGGDGPTVGIRQAIVKAAIIFDETTISVQLEPGDINIHGRFSVVTEAQIKADHPQMLLEARNLWGLQGELGDQLLVTRQRRQMMMPAGEVPAGACVMTDGSCEVMTQSQCLGMGGTYQGDNTTCDMPEWEWVIDFAQLKRFDMTTDQKAESFALKSKQPPLSGWSKEPAKDYAIWATGGPCP